MAVCCPAKRTALHERLKAASEELRAATPAEPESQAPESEEPGTVEIMMHKKGRKQ